MMISSSSDDSCSQVVAGNYDVIVEESASFRTILTEFLDKFKQLESDLLVSQRAQQQQEQQQLEKQLESQQQEENHQEKEQQQDCKEDTLQEQTQQPQVTKQSIPTSSYSNEFKLLKEFSQLLKKDKANYHEGELEYNLRKNRYRDIIPFSHTRVTLSSDNINPGSDYINANYVKGPSGSSRAYIACQGPLRSTLNDFWRMIWECGVSVIIMACNEHESDKPKCELYWPEQVGLSQSYGSIQVSLVKERQICPDFLIRKFSVKYTLEPKQSSTPPAPPPPPLPINEYQSNNLLPESRGVILERTICQFHYTTWPDHGAPDSIQPILDLVQLMRYVQPTEDKPILIHCSAGCGRTGTICCIDYVWGLMRQGKLESNFDLCNIISEMRQQRMSMVQTLAQYVLCHRAVATLFVRQLKLMDEDNGYEDMDVFEGEDETHDKIEGEQEKRDFNEDNIENVKSEELGSVYI